MTQTISSCSGLVGLFLSIANITTASIESSVYYASYRSEEVEYQDRDYLVTYHIEESIDNKLIVHILCTKSNSIANRISMAV